MYSFIYFDVCDSLNISRCDFIDEQKRDASLRNYFQLALDGDIETASKCDYSYNVRHGVLPRDFRMKDKCAQQIVIPELLRERAFCISHERTSLGHCSAKDTLDKARQNFFWPGMFVHISKFIASCDVCHHGPEKRDDPVM